ncbi:hypothetical protein NM688_g2977 [Phlebia brevispora]|uniref:Uncharacterized protein n=1 Tax=Phlebia brevispora TaxID=194682 RepID=A0ACC1T744_9APHY|nr:hypothetical protein NM688_g2977 [Phlebia brevispora]
MAPKSGSSLFLGLELATDQLRASILDENLELVGVENVDFDTELPEFQTQGGIFTTPGEAYTTPVEMWVKAFDMLMEKLGKSYELARIKAVGGSAQQALVWWKSSNSPGPSRCPNTAVAQDTSAQRALIPNASVVKLLICLNAEVEPEIALPKPLAARSTADHAFILAITSQLTAPLQHAQISTSIMASALRGWATIEKHMAVHDETTMKKYSDDIDTLLVFAGLFSAVLTAFVVVSYPSLQPDNSQVSIDLLMGISTQLSSFTVSGGYVNSTASSASPAPFQAASSAVAINSLWFLSLVFSFAAALYGILVKQWIREYLQWNYVLAPARENVLVRQVQFEAWYEWKVPMVAASIPVMLEMALILFLCGLVIFLWTLESTVAAVITVAIAILLIFTFLFAILPAFSNRCPYKSPTAWAFVFLLHFIRRVIQRRVWAVRVFNAPSRPPSWRQRCLEVVASEVFPNTKAGRDLELTMPPQANRGGGELELLTRALAWVLCGSEDSHLINDVSQCVQLLRTSCGEVGRSPIGTAGRTFHISFYLLRNRPLLGPRSTEQPDFQDVPQNSYCNIGNVMYVFTSGLHLTYLDTPRHPRRDLREVGLKSRWILRRLALLDLRALVEDWIARLTPTRWSSAIRRPDPKEILEAEAYAVLDDIFQFLFLVCLYGKEASTGRLQDQDPVYVKDCADVLIELYSQLDGYPVAHGSGLTGAIVEVLCTIKKLEYEYLPHGVVRTGRIKLATDDEPEEWDLPIDSAWLLAAQLYNGERSEDRNLFILTSSLALRCLKADSHTSVQRSSYFGVPDHKWPETCKELLSKMTAVAERSVNGSISNCGCYADLPWVGHLREVLEYELSGGVSARVLTHEVNLEMVFRLLSALDKGVQLGLITGTTVQDDLAKSLELVQPLRGNVPREAVPAAFATELISAPSTTIAATATSTLHCTERNIPSPIQRVSSAASSSATGIMRTADPTRPQLNFSFDRYK